MKAHTKKLSGTLVIFMLVLVLAIPAMAIAAEDVCPKSPKTSRVGSVDNGDGPVGNGDAPMKADSPLPEPRKAMLKSRLQERLQVRETIVDCAADGLMSRITRMEAIAARLAEAGCDVDGSLALLTQARADVGQALALEAQVARMFEACPDADEPRVAFREACDAAGEASQTLRNARQKASQAARWLGICARGLITG